ncbi:MAG: helix-turn-helix transcriptional regulator [Pseudomonadota bacterium]|nr:helix-turn-helix transcriptional regulator [Pseudomonadota bacterium]MDE3037149.1 helix-turn-helix transcriptional regulator [Pseudomonadota bacterium]
MPNKPKITEDNIQALADVFRLLGDANRLRIILTCLHGECSVGDISEKTGISQPLVSHHLRLLKAMRLMKSEKQGKQVFCSLTDEHISCVLEDMVHHIGEEDHD